MILGTAWIQVRRVGSASTPSRRFFVDALPVGASWRSVAQAMQDFGPLYSEPCAGLDGDPGCRLHCRQELQGVLVNILHPSSSGPLLHHLLLREETAR